MEISPILTIFHFNDVYDIQPDQKQPKAGVAWFKSLLDRYKKQYKNNLTLFSGDAFSPSLLSTQFQGTNMIIPLNSLGIDLACFGNHDLDYHLDHVLELKSKTNFPWLLSNIYDKRTQRRLAEGLQYQIIQKYGIKIGIFSLAQKQWIDTLLTQYHDICQYIPFVQFAQEMVQLLKIKQKCDIIIALTHMMKYNDLKLAKQVSGIDLILGGHDHLIVHQKIQESILVKSGTNFRNFSIINVYKHENQFQSKGILLESKNWKFTVQLLEVNHALHNIEPDKQLDQYVHSIYKQFAQKQARIDLTFKTIRKQQSSFLQFMAAFYRHYAKADCAFMNSGNFRADCKLQAGPITFATLTNVIQDLIVVKIIPGEDVIKCLENCISMYPNLAGRFAALSGLSFVWDADQPSFSRVKRDTVMINGEHIDLKRQYRVAMHGFMSMGGDGFTFVKNYPKDDQKHEEIKNLLLIHELSDPQSELVKSFCLKYPKLVHQIEVQGKKYLELDLPPPKNVKMLSSANH